MFEDQLISEDTDVSTPTGGTYIVDEYTVIKNADDPMGDVGRFYIPSVDVSVAVYGSSVEDYQYAQAVVDRQDSAVMQYYSASMPYIADHWNQGFINIKDCVQGTKAYLKRTDGSIECYSCTIVTTGHNIETDMVLDDYTSMDYVQGDLYCYTCNGCWQNIYIIVFERCDIPPSAGIVVYDEDGVILDEFE